PQASGTRATNATTAAANRERMTDDSGSESATPRDPPRGGFEGFYDGGAIGPSRNCQGADYTPTVAGRLGLGAVSKTHTRPSVEPAATREPSGEMATAAVSAWASWISPSLMPALGSHRMTRPPSDTDTTCPFGRNRAARRLSWWAMRNTADCGFGSSVSQRMTVRSRPIVDSRS